MIIASTLPCGIYAESYSIAAIVGSKIITRLELQNLVEAIAALDSSAAENESMLKQQVLGVLVKTNMQLNVAEKMGAELTQKEKKAVLSSQKESLAKLAGKKPLQDAYNSFILAQHSASKVMQMVMRERIQIDENMVAEKRSEIMRENTQYYVKDIVLPSEEHDLTKDQEQTLASLQATWKKKKLLVKSLPNGFDMQVYKWAVIDELPDVFKSSLLAMKRNDVSVPIKAENGWHLLKLVGVRNKANDAKVKDDDIRQLLFAELAQDVEKQWLESLEQQQYIDLKTDA